jgi:hypothetical protein
VNQTRLPGGKGSQLAVHTYVCGIEIGGRGQRVVIADGAGSIVGQARSIDSMTPASGALEIVRGLVDQACNAAGIDLEQIVRIGVAFGGPVDVGRGLTLLSHRVSGFEDFPLVNLIEDEFKIPTVLDNSARAAALGEVLYGAARGSSDVVYVHLGTGVGGGMFLRQTGTSRGLRGGTINRGTIPRTAGDATRRRHEPLAQSQRHHGKGHFRCGPSRGRRRKGNCYRDCAGTGTGGCQLDYDLESGDRDNRRVGVGRRLTPHGSVERESAAVFVSIGRSARPLDRESAWSRRHHLRSRGAGAAKLKRMKRRVHLTKIVESNVHV